MKKSLSLLAGAALVTGAGMAAADEPLMLSESQMDGVTAAGFSFSLDKDIYTTKVVYVDVNKFVFSYADPHGNLADAEAVADAYGDDTLAETFTFTRADSGSSLAISESISAAN